MKRILPAIVILLFAVCCLSVRADSDVPDSAIAETIRRGDLVTHTGDGRQATDAETFAQVMAVPEDDSHKWFISVLTSPGCQSCEKLKADWKSSPVLRAFANPDDPKQSWAHYHVYRSDDPTQSWRWKNLRISTYPTILIQPPRNRQFGDPATVVMQRAGYAGDAKPLAQAMSGAIRQYVEELSKTGVDPTGLTQGNQRQTTDERKKTPYDPPFTPIPPDVDVPPVTPFVPNLPVVIPPDPKPDATPSAGQVLLQAVAGTLASRALTSLLLMVLIGVQVWRAFRKATHQPLLLDDDVFERIRQIIASLVPASEQATTSPPAESRRAERDRRLP